MRLITAVSHRYIPLIRTVSQREVAAHEYTDVLEEELVIDEADLVRKKETCMLRWLE